MFIVAALYSHFDKKKIDMFGMLIIIDVLFIDIKNFN